jgi:hypothetical protein
MLDKEFYMRNPHFMLDQLDEPIFHKNLDVFFSTYFYIHAGNMFIDDMPYKNMFNGPYIAIFFGIL